MKIIFIHYYSVWVLDHKLNSYYWNFVREFIKFFFKSQNALSVDYIYNNQNIDLIFKLEFNLLFYKFSLLWNFFKNINTFYDNNISTNKPQSKRYKKKYIQQEKMFKYMLKQKLLFLRLLLIRFRKSIKITNKLFHNF